MHQGMLITIFCGQLNIYNNVKSKELGFSGVQIGSHVNNWNLDAPELQSVFAVSPTPLNFVMPKYGIWS